MPWGSVLQGQEETEMPTLQHAVKDTMGDCPGPRKETYMGRNGTQGRLYKCMLLHSLA